jgi:hypothetical protein
VALRVPPASREQLRPIAGHAASEDLCDIDVLVLLGERLNASVLRTGQQRGLNVTTSSSRCFAPNATGSTAALGTSAVESHSTERGSMGRRTRSIARWIVYGVGALVIVAVFALFAGTGYQYLENRRDLREHPAPGQLVEIGGHRLHLWCTGAGLPSSCWRRAAWLHLWSEVACNRRWPGRRASVRTTGLAWAGAI